MDNVFYVYVYLDPRKPGKFVYGEYEFDYEPFYVGKGKGDRIKAHLSNQGRNKNNVLKYEKINHILELGLDPIAIKYKENLSEDDSYNLEKDMIIKIGRLYPHTGPLTNISDGGDGSHGYQWTDESKKKMSKIMKGRFISEEHRRKISEAQKGEKGNNYGKHISEEQKKKISEANKGKKLSEEHKKKIGDAHRGEKNKWFGTHWNLGKHHTDETKKKLSDVGRGRHHTEETKKKISEGRKGQATWNKGKKMSEETKQKISEACKGKKNALGKKWPEEAKRKASEMRSGENGSNFGKHPSEETRQKMRESRLRYLSSKNNQ